MPPGRENAGRLTTDALSVTGPYGSGVVERLHAGARPPKRPWSLKLCSPFTIPRRYASQCVVTA